MNVILKISNQTFHYMEEGEVDDENITCKLSSELTGTIFICSGICDDDDDLIFPFGLEDGKDEGKIAFWYGFPEVESLWNRLIKVKNKYSHLEEDNK